MATRKKTSVKEILKRTRVTKESVGKAAKGSRVQPEKKRSRNGGGGGYGNGGGGVY